MTIEYVIWGVPDGCKHEELLCEVVRGERITDSALAQGVKLQAKERGFSKVRIQALDMGLSGVDLANMWRGVLA